MRTFDDLFHGKSNYFTALRLFAALCVVVSHSWLLTLGEHHELLRAETGYTLGQHAVTVFFSISGFLVFASLERYSSIVPFICARVARIFPGFIVSVVLVTIWGAILTDLKPDIYFQWLIDHYYFIRMIIAFDGGINLPGIFKVLTTSGAVMGTIWTLKYELLCYLGLAIFGLLQLKRFQWIYVCIGMILATLCLRFNINTANVDAVTGLHHAIRFTASFFIGMMFYRFRANVPHHWGAMLVLWLLVWITSYTSTYNLILYITIAYTSLYIALIPNHLKLPDLDISYGVYLYGWPIQQTLISTLVITSPIIISISTIVLSIAFGILSWYFIEHPALNAARNYIRKHYK